MINHDNLTDDKKVEFEMFAHYGYSVVLSQKFEKAIAALLQGEFPCLAHDQKPSSLNIAGLKFLRAAWSKVNTQ